METRQIGLIKFNKLRPLRLTHWVERVAVPADVSRTVPPNTLVTVQGEPILAYFEPDWEPGRLEAFRKMLMSLTYTRKASPGGQVTLSAAFGNEPRGKGKCQPSLIARKYPQKHRFLDEVATALAGAYAEHFPTQYGHHLRQVQEQVRPEDRIEETPFTNGIINRSNNLRYHFDKGNFDSGLTCMVVVRQGVDGGQLNFPGLDLGIPCNDGSVAIWDGLKLLHGVTPMSGSGDRFSVVYYALRKFWDCNPLTEQEFRQ